LKSLYEKLFGWLSRGREPLSEQEAERLRNLFRTRYHDFKLLLAANHKAMGLMTELEVAQEGEQVFSMAFVQARATALLVNVYRMVQHLDRLAPEKYGALGDRFMAIQDAMNALLERPPSVDDDRLVVPLGELDRDCVGQVGGKMANLGEIHNRLGLSVPPGFSVTTAAYRRFIEHNDLDAEIARLVQTLERERIDQLYALSSQIRQRIVAAEVPTDVAQAIYEAYERLEQQTEPGIHVAMRSSAVAEDAGGQSFAGQYSSVLNVGREDLLAAYREVVASKYSPQAIQYRLHRGLRDRDLPMAVGCLAMVEASAGGVAYSRGVLGGGDDRVHISATWGLPKAVVDGSTSADRFAVARSEPGKVVERSIAHKQARVTAQSAEGVARQQVEAERAEQPSLDDAQITAVARAALQLEDHYGSAQDVEWAIDRKGRLVVLQSRPLRRAELPATERSAAAVDAEPLLRAGVVASSGVASGAVHWVRREADALTFPDGAVLAVEDPAPRWAVLLGRAAAVVAVHGDVAGHLATVAREYGRPALFGLGPHAAGLEQGQTITLHAEGRAIYAGVVDELLSREARPEPSLMHGSPVHRSLTELLRHVTPLGLLDPDSPDFRAERCQSLHDITRFCHERSVREMFRFGKDHDFPERASKQLHHNVPMQWWVLNLDDGFHREVEGKYVTLEDIACGPMHALWEGMTAIAWDGPPAMSGRGLASVLFEATANPALSTPFRKPYGNRNYFMIARDFMNLQSRFGFHFTTVETLMGERTTENYLRFMFKGGAADLERRIARVRFIGELLGDHGFSVEIHEDTALARLTHLSAQAMAERVRVMGYLLMHTRQLDMIMADPAAVRRHRAKIDRDIASLGGADPSGA